MQLEAIMDNGCSLEAFIELMSMHSKRSSALPACVQQYQPRASLHSATVRRVGSAETA
jgi:hypothetical protein